MDCETLKTLSKSEMKQTNGGFIATAAAVAGALAAVYVAGLEAAEAAGYAAGEAACG